MWSPPAHRTKLAGCPCSPMRTGNKKIKPPVLTCPPGPQELRENIFAIGGNVKGCSAGKTDQPLYRVCTYMRMYIYTGVLNVNDFFSAASNVSVATKNDSAISTPGNLQVKGEGMTARSSQY